MSAQGGSIQTVAKAKGTLKNPCTGEVVVNTGKIRLLYHVNTSKKGTHYKLSVNTTSIGLGSFGFEYRYNLSGNAQFDQPTYIGLLGHYIFDVPNHAVESGDGGTFHLLGFMRVRIDPTSGVTVGANLFVDQSECVGLWMKLPTSSLSFIQTV